MTTRQKKTPMRGNAAVLASEEDRDKIFGQPDKMVVETPTKTDDKTTDKKKKKDSKKREDYGEEFATDDNIILSPEAAPLNKQERLFVDKLHNAQENTGTISGTMSVGKQKSRRKTLFGLFKKDVVDDEGASTPKKFVPVYKVVKGIFCNYTLYYC